MIDCIHQGPCVGVASRDCCGGKSVTEKAYRCLSQDVHASFCISVEAKPSLVAIQFHGDDSPQVVHTAFCGSCDQRVRPSR